MYHIESEIAFVYLIEGDVAFVFHIDCEVTLCTISGVRMLLSII